MNGQVVNPGRDAYIEVVSALRNTEPSQISIPRLSSLLRVKTTTLNARLRRERIEVRTVGRTNFISRDLALRLADLHKYALMGWLTLKHASELTAVKSATIKARCETGKLEGHIDLTKRLRISPSALESLRASGMRKAGTGGLCRASGVVQRSYRSRNGKNGATRDKPRSYRQNASGKQARGNGDGIPAAPFTLPTPLAPQIRLITRKDYGLPEIEEPLPDNGDTLKAPPEKRREKPAFLTYDPAEPFSVSECAVGRRIRYEQYDGRILNVIDDPFNPQIRAAFPEHQHPLMREVLLIVGRKRS